MPDGEGEEEVSGLLKRVEAGREQITAKKAAEEEATLRAAVKKSPAGFSSVVERQTGQRVDPKNKTHSVPSPSEPPTGK